MTLSDIALAYLIVATLTGACLASRAIKTDSIATHKSAVETAFAIVALSLGWPFIVLWLIGYTATELRRNAHLCYWLIVTALFLATFAIAPDVPA